ncbi:NAD(P)-dependent malic enzyme [Aeropyrum camini]|uniref:Malate dehydrogenase n=1 Tax=Aeropyrum camini SY1 = JCM 12091 TaxID=1198449 RepID=U3TBF9_9CREN|nr:NADP-dependent malic enzyme [Aeropyrum camini]BAN89756.1 malate dehydrogenase [Aeropyrum camini SY1 = JCM 12091]
MAGDDGSGSIDSDRIIEVYRRYAGKIEVMPKVPVSSVGDFAIWYTPGVAEASIRINKDPDESFELTSRWNMVAIVTDATRVLGLGSLKPEAAYPVMEGKALIFKLFGGVDAVPIVHRRREPGAFASLVKDLEPSFGGVNLEDIESPKCFYLLDFLRMELEIPVWHDDQQGTAAASLAGLINAFKIVGKNLRESRIVLLGAGAANIALYRFLKAYGVNPRNIVVVDSRGVLHPEREDMDRLLFSNRYKYEIALETEGGGLRPGSGVEEALKGADALVAASRPGPGVVKKEWIRGMSRDPIVFALANPTPEIWPWEAREAGARVVATGRSDLPNQVNNALVFPGVFRGALDARSRAITDGMAIAAAEEIARYTEEELGLDEERILPPITDWQVHYRVAAAVAWAASREKVARKPRTYRQELENARAIVESSRRKYEALLSAGLIERLV